MDSEEIIWYFDRKVLAAKVPLGEGPTYCCTA